MLHNIIYYYYIRGEKKLTGTSTIFPENYRRTFLLLMLCMEFILTVTSYGRMDKGERKGVGKRSLCGCGLVNLY